MRVLVDLTYITTGDFYAGISVFSYSIIPGLIRYGTDDGIEVLGLVNASNREMLATALHGVELIEMPFRDFHRFHYTNGVINKRALDRVIEEHHIDLFFLPFLSDRGLWTAKVPMVATMHDAQGFKVKTNLLRRLLYRVFTSYYASKPDVIVTISQYARKDILRTVKSIHQRVEVIYQSLPFKALTGRPQDRPGVPYILSVNTLQPYKNPMTIVKAWELLKDEIPHSLYFKGLKSAYSEQVLRPYIEQRGLQDRVRILSDQYTPQQMDALYSHADLFVSGSTMEGFGLTPIESAMHLVPAICADIEPVRETTRGLLRYYSPVFDEHALAGEILSALKSPQDMRPVAHEYESFYTTERQSREYIRVFKSLVQ